MRRRHRQPDQQIDLSAVKLARQGFVIVGTHDEAHVGPALAKMRQGAGQRRGDEIARSTDADHQLGAWAVTAEMHDLVVDREQPARISNHRFAMRRETHALDAAIKHIAAKQELQPLDLRAHRRLRHPQLGRGFGETALIDDGDKGTQQVSWNIDHYRFWLHSRSNCMRIT
jgi:hypothetical protein